MRKNKNIFTSKGLTFAEMIVVIFIFSFFLYGIYATLDFGMKSWQMGEVKSDLYQRAQLALNSIVKEFMCSAWLTTQMDPNDPNYICFETPVDFSDATVKVVDGKPEWQGYICYYIFKPTVDGKKNLYRRFKPLTTKNIYPDPLSASDVTSCVTNINEPSGETVRVLVRDIDGIKFEQKETSLQVTVIFKIENMRELEDSRVMFSGGEKTKEYLELKTAVTPRN